jgi:hypothetical protein
MALSFHFRFAVFFELAFGVRDCFRFFAFRRRWFGLAFLCRSKLPLRTQARVADSVRVAGVSQRAKARTSC